MKRCSLFFFSCASLHLSPTALGSVTWSLTLLRDRQEAVGRESRLKISAEKTKSSDTVRYQRIFGPSDWIRTHDLLVPNDSAKCCCRNTLSRPICLNTLGVFLFSFFAKLLTFFIVLFQFGYFEFWYSNFIFKGTYYFTVMFILILVFVLHVENNLMCITCYLRIVKLHLPHFIV